MVENQEIKTKKFLIYLWSSRDKVLQNWVVLYPAVSREYILENRKKIEKDIAYANVWMWELKIYCVSFGETELKLMDKPLLMVDTREIDNFLYGPVKARFGKK